MTPSEVADLLSLSVELDRYSTADKMTKEKVVAWAAVFGQEAPAMTFDEAQPLVIRYYGTAGESLTPFALIDLWRAEKRMMPSQIAADVRVAKRLGMVAADHWTRDPLPADVARRLAEYRAGVNAEAPAIESGPLLSPLGLDVGRRV
ncbi:hypothetical protein EDF60_1662 [Leucobacter luti]|uniref:hypothetical protein n=1 Tax=Leucobacter luti TaxID=340320 RepID=UPI0010465359|nr:hypothetical protein [Leucobacter luti]MCW2287011.1 hypothetical protein [Leucobacter luti]TCK41236.1 hypothetical protein EDF60_1662 [Leucobacter luti]